MSVDLVTIIHDELELVHSVTWISRDWVTSRPHPVSPVIEPSKVHAGDRIGFLTLLDRPVLQSDQSWVAKAQCDCGWIVQANILSHFSCGCHKGMSPSHHMASRWTRNHGAYRLEQMVA
jgi:hypothetical protein